MIRIYYYRSIFYSDQIENNIFLFVVGNTLEKALNKIGRDDIVKKCIFNVELITDDVEKAVARVRLDQPGFDSLKEELGPSRDTSLRRDATMDPKMNPDYDDFNKSKVCIYRKRGKRIFAFFFIQINFFLPQESESMEELDISGTKRDKCTYFKNLFISYRLLQFLILKSVYYKVYKVKNIFRTESRLQCYTRSITLERI